MVYRGHVVSGGLIHLEGAVVLPEGAEVRVEYTVPAKKIQDTTAPPIEEVLRAIVADVPKEEWDRLPADLSDNLDHYIYGTPK
jgi:hypothetical protein